MTALSPGTLVISYFDDVDSWKKRKIIMRKNNIILKIMHLGPEKHKPNHVTTQSKLKLHRGVQMGKVVRNYFTLTRDTK